MNARTIFYWIATAITAFIFLSGGVVDALRLPFAMQGMRHLGYPDYFMVILGVWKVLGGLTVLSPRLPRLKEWAYAGMMFDLTGASASHVATGDPLGKAIVPLILFGIVIASWALRPRSRRLCDSGTATSSKSSSNAPEAVAVA